jgi:hypothetical protein
MIDNLSFQKSFALPWQMTNCERFALVGLLERLHPKVSLEIGTYKGGSLQVLSRFSEAVISVDLDPAVANSLAGKFPNVVFRSGDSNQLLPQLVQELNEQRRPVGFVLVDGDHSAAGVRRDIEALLEIIPQQELVLLLHDSFNPGCREGMRSADWGRSPFVQDVELDFIPGIYHHNAHDTADPRCMLGGFACAVLSPAKRTGSLVVRESQLHLHEAVKRVSSHVPGNLWRRLRRRLGALRRRWSMQNSPV